MHIPIHIWYGKIVWKWPGAFQIAIRVNRPVVITAPFISASLRALAQVAVRKRVTDYRLKTEHFFVFLYLFISILDKKYFPTSN